MAKALEKVVARHRGNPPQADRPGGNLRKKVRKKVSGTFFEKRCQEPFSQIFAFCA
jgi:hypothetical protein